MARPETHYSGDGRTDGDVNRWSARIMRRNSTSAGRKQIDRLFAGGSLVGLTDRELLRRFLAGEMAEAAFEALVDRHGPMVRAVCRSMLGDPHEADDAFQATFLVLARRAGSIRRGDAVGSWLYGVARRVASRARGEAARRRMLARYLGEQARHEPSRTEPPESLMPELLEEVERLPERYRAPIVLCYLEGQSHEQAALVLGCAIRTVQTRLQRGRAKLRTRLVRRGLAPATVLAAIGVESAEAAAPALTGSIPAAPSESTARASVQFAAARAAGLAGAAIGLAQGVLRSLFWNRLRRAALGLGLVSGLALTLLAISASGQKPEKPAVTVAGRVLDDRGRPIAGAEVWMPTRFLAPADATPHATTDARGNYVLAVPASWSRTPLHERDHLVWAYAAGHRIASISAGKALYGKPESVDLTLGPATDTSFVVVGADGRPVGGAVVEPYLVDAPNGITGPPPAAMMPAIRGTTDATGRAMLPAMAREGFEGIKVTTVGLGSQYVGLRGGADEPARREIHLRPAGRLEGHVVAARPEWTRGVKVYVATKNARSLGPGADGAEGSAEVTTDDNGRVVVPAIAEGRLEAAPRLDPSLPVRARPIDRVEVRANQTTMLAIFLQKAVRIRGAIRVKGTGEPVAGASINVDYGWGNDARGPSGAEEAAGEDTVVSDAAGRFETYGLPGGARMQVIYLPEAFAHLGSVIVERHPVPPDAETFDLPVIEVARGVSISGRLVDADDRPIADARVFAAEGREIPGFSVTDGRGDFTMSGVPPGREFTYTAELKPGGMGLDVEIARQSPLLLRAATRPVPKTAEATGIRGTVVDEGGRPVEGAEVNLTIEADRLQNHEVLHTDARGAYHAPVPVKKGTRYRSIVAPGKYAIASSETVTATDSGPITLPPIRVARLRTILGRVVDTSGRPVIGARVLNWGNATPLATAVTGPSGRFQLGGFPRERASLFLAAPGFRFHRVTPDPGKSTVEVTLRREDQPAERGVASLGPPVPRERALELAAKVLKPYAEAMLKPGSDPEFRRRTLEVLARIDPDVAWQKCQAGEEPWDCDAVRVEVFRHLAASKPEEAEAILSTIPSPYWRATLRCELADALPAEARDRKQAMICEATADARRVANAGPRIGRMMEAATRIMDLGHDDEARRLIDEALPIARQPGDQQTRLLRIRGLIGELARLDLEAARALIPEKGDERMINDLRGLIAQGVAARHPGEAERLFSEMTWNKSESYMVKACRRMGRVDLPRARRIAERIDNSVLRGYALGRMAEEIGASDLARARELQLDSYRTFQQALERDLNGVWGPPTAAIMAAALLPGVERTDPDRLAEAFDRVVSLRWYPRSVFDVTTVIPDMDSGEAMRINATLAAVLARYDHELARSIARPIIERLKAPLRGPDGRFFQPYAVLPCLALADPEGAAELAEVIPENREEQGARAPQGTARLIIAGALASPESRFWTVIREAFSDLEIVERDD
jgi:RNA polymerase sigma factor (sigma-70 family)